MQAAPMPSCVCVWAFGCGCVDRRCGGVFGCVGVSGCHRVKEENTERTHQQRSQEISHTTASVPRLGPRMCPSLLTHSGHIIDVECKLLA
jgi:hypothetical protein